VKNDPAAQSNAFATATDRDAAANPRGE